MEATSLLRFQVVDCTEGARGAPVSAENGIFDQTAMLHSLGGG